MMWRASLLSRPTPQSARKRSMNGSMPVAPVIHTPDQRLRVFVSSTLGELADERRAVREVVEQLRLTPVMFELGARPHPPRELYRSYLAQSNVFVGIYWQRYGWIAPGEDVSGLEDEYRLAENFRDCCTSRSQPSNAMIVSGHSSRTSLRTTALPTSGSRHPRSSRDTWRTTLLSCFPSDSRARRQVATPVSHLTRRSPAPTSSVGTPKSTVSSSSYTAVIASSRSRELVGSARRDWHSRSRTRSDLDPARTFVPLDTVHSVGRAFHTIAERLGALPDGRRWPRDAIVDHVRGHGNAPRPRQSRADPTHRISDRRAHRSSTGAANTRHQPTRTSYSRRARGSGSAAPDTDAGAHERVAGRGARRATVPGASGRSRGSRRPRR